jgi:hypothetical protein
METRTTTKTTYRGHEITVIEITPNGAGRGTGNGSWYIAAHDAQAEQGPTGEAHKAYECAPDAIDGATKEIDAILGAPDHQDLREKIADAMNGASESTLDTLGQTIARYQTARADKSPDTKTINAEIASALIDAIQFEIDRREDDKPSEAPTHARNKKASERTLAHYARARTAMGTILTEIRKEEDNASKGQAHYGHAGTADHAATQLEEIAKFLTGTE